MLPTALEEINRSDLPASTCRNALQLLALAHADNGHVMIAWQDLAAMWDISVGRSRKHLGTMQAANLLHYSSNGDGIVYVNFKAWTRVGARKTATEWTENARGRAENGHDLTRASAPDLTDRLTDHPIDSKVSQSVTDPDEQRRTTALLRDIRIDGPDAHRIARAHPFERVRDCIAAWWMNRKSVGGKLQNGPGIVIFWLDNWPDKPPNHYEPADWRKTDLYRMHRTPEEVAAGATGDQGGDEAERRRMYIPEEFRDIAVG